MTIKFDVLNRFTGAVQFTAEIECDEGASVSVKLGLAVRWAVKARAYLADADLAGADLADANLAYANLAGAEWRDGITVTRAPIQVYGLAYPIAILDAHMQIGCELHTFDEWDGFDDERISQMDGVNARRFWRDHKSSLMALCRLRAAKKELAGVE